MMKYAFKIKAWSERFSIDRFGSSYCSHFENRDPRGKMRGAGKCQRVKGGEHLRGKILRDDG